MLRKTTDSHLTAFRYLAAAVILSLSATPACTVNGNYGNGDDNFFSAFSTIGDAAWDYGIPLTFTADTLRDSVARGTLLLSLRHTAAYAYGNIWLEIIPDLAAGTPDTLDIALADRYGRWLGSGTGPSVQKTDTIRRNFALRRGQRLRIRHIMRTDTLDGIEQVGLTFIPDN